MLIFICGEASCPECRKLSGRASAIGETLREIRIYDNVLIVWNPGGLPPGLTMEDLFKPHASKLRNKGLAEVFFDTKIIEQWGSGIEKMINYCKEAGAQEPVFEEY
ncbi:MAG: ATP-binding protein [Methanosarcina sp.]